MKATSLAIATVIVATGPALAAPTHVAHPSHHLLYHSHPADSQGSAVTRDPIGVYQGGQQIGRDQHHLHRARQSTNPNASVKDPMGVYMNGRMIGRDPDANIRQELKEDYSLYHYDQD